MLTRLTVMLAIAVSLAACGGGDSDESRTATIEAALPPNYAPAVFWSQANEAQQERFADGEITFSDYEGAMFAYLDCKAEHGAELFSGPTYNPATRRYKVSMAIPGDPEDWQPIAGACYDSNLAFVDLAWQERNRPGVADLERARRAMAVCLHEAGYESVPELPSENDYQPVLSSPDGPEDLARCISKVQVEEDVPGFGG